MKKQLDFTDAVIVDHGKVVMRVLTDAQNGETVIYSRKFSGEAVNDAHHIDPANSKRGRISRANIYVGNAQLMTELPYGYCEIEESTNQAVNQ